MNSNNIFSSQSAATDPKQQGRSRVKVAVFSVLAVHVAGLMALLMTQGCKRDTSSDVDSGAVQPPEVPEMGSNAAGSPPTNEYYTAPDPYLTPPSNPVVPEISQPIAPPAPVPPQPVVTEYVIQKGDTFSSIASQHGTTAKAIAAANPGVDPLRLQINQKIVLPSPNATAATPAPEPLADNIYVVKSGDTLSRIARRNETTVKELKSLNGLVTDQIKVGQKLKLPPKSPPPAPLPDTAPVVPTMPTPTPAPGN